MISRKTFKKLYNLARNNSKAVHNEFCSGASFEECNDYYCKDAGDVLALAKTELEDEDDNRSP